MELVRSFPQGKMALKELLTRKPVTIHSKQHQSSRQKKIKNHKKKIKKYWLHRLPASNSNLKGRNSSGGPHFRNQKQVAEYFIVMFLFSIYIK